MWRRRTGPSGLCERDRAGHVGACRVAVGAACAHRTRRAAQCPIFPSDSVVNFMDRARTTRTARCILIKFNILLVTMPCNRINHHVRARACAPVSSVRAGSCWWRANAPTELTHVFPDTHAHRVLAFVPPTTETTRRCVYAYVVSRGDRLLCAHASVVSLLWSLSPHPSQVYVARRVSHSRKSLSSRLGSLPVSTW